MRARLTVATVVVTVLAAAGALTAPAAGAAKVLDRKALVERVRAAVAAAHPELVVTAVRCPKSVPGKPGATAECTVTAGPTQLGMLVTVADKKGRVTIASTHAVIPKANAEFLVAANATLAATVDCGPEPFLVRRPGETITCTATFEDGSSEAVTLTTTDTAGNVAISGVTVAP